MLFRRIEEASGYCGRCLKQTPVRHIAIRHWPHLVLTLLTGVWVIFWILDFKKVKREQKWLCMRCGAEVYKIMSPIEI